MAKPGQTLHYNQPVETEIGFSALVHANGLLHLAGIVSINKDLTVHAPGDMAAQIERIYDILEETLALCGATLAHVVSEVIYTTDIAKFMEAGAVRSKRYQGHYYPAATAVQIVALAFPDALLEIQVTAQLDGKEWSADTPSPGF